MYLGRRDFVDHISHVDPIDGVVLVDPEYLNGRKVFGHVLAAFRYGREDLDVLGKSLDECVSENDGKGEMIFKSFRSVRADISQRPLSSLITNLPAPGREQEASDATSRKADKEIRRKCPPILLRAATSLPRLCHLTARPRGHGQALWY